MIIAFLFIVFMNHIVPCIMDSKKWWNQIIHEWDRILQSNMKSLNLTDGTKVL